MSAASKPGAGAGIVIRSGNNQGSKPQSLTSERQWLSKQTRPAFVAIQESGAAPWKNLKPVKDNPRLKTGQISGPSGKGAGRSSRSAPVYVAVQTPEPKPGKNAPMRNSQILMSNEPFLSVGEVPGGKTGPGLRQPLAVMTKSATVATAHEASGVPAFAAKQSAAHVKGLQDWMKKRAKSKRQSSAQRWAFVADNNTSRKRLLNATAGMGVHITSPSRASHQSGSTLDHMVSPVPARVKALTGMSGDHMPHEFELEFAASSPSKGPATAHPPSGGDYGPVRSRHSDRIAKRRG
jgi:hypothetical protein